METSKGPRIRRLLLLASLLAAAAVAVPAIPATADDVLVERFEDADWWVDEVVGDGRGWTDYRHSDNGGTDDLNSGIVAGYRKQGLGVTIPPSHHRGSGAHHLLPPGLEEAWFRYHIVLDRWDTADTGKLPGFADVGARTARGCIRSTPNDPGWSARVMFNRPGEEGAPPGWLRLGYYTYHLDQPGSCGEHMPWNDEGILRQGRWYCIEGHVKVNTPGQHDGVLEAWVDGKRVFRRTDLAFRRNGERNQVKLRSLWLNVYFGGEKIVNDKNLSLRIDQLVVRDHGRAPCLTRFTDDDGNIHESNIEYLFDEGLVFGCHQNRYCPKKDITRAQMLALIDRKLRPPATDRDSFGDDDGHWAEGVINRLAAVGVISGCGPGRVCPDEPVTRGQMAAFLRRAFSIPAADNTDRFTDDDGSVFEGDIDAIAATGITKGCSPNRYCPNKPTRRDQMASLFARTVRWAAPLPPSP